MSLSLYLPTAPNTLTPSQAEAHDARRSAEAEVSSLTSDLAHMKGRAADLAEKLSAAESEARAAEGRAQRSAEVAAAAQVCAVRGLGSQQVPVACGWQEL